MSHSTDKMKIIFWNTTQEQIKFYLILRSCFDFNVPILLGNEFTILNLNINNNINFISNGPFKPITFVLLEPGHKSKTIFAADRWVVLKLLHPRKQYKLRT